MKPHSKIILIVSHAIEKIGGPDSILLVLCEDGSVWHLTLDGEFKLIAEMDGAKYA